MWSISNLIYRIEDGIAIKAEAKYTYISSGIETSNKIWVRLPEPSGNIIPFDDLTEQEVLQWVYDNYDTDTVELKVQEEHNKILSDPNRERLPWLN